MDRDWHPGLTPRQTPSPMVPPALLCTTLLSSAPAAVPARDAGIRPSELRAHPRSTAGDVEVYAVAEGRVLRLLLSAGDLDGQWRPAVPPVTLVAGKNARDVLPAGPVPPGRWELPRLVPTGGEVRAERLPTGEVHASARGLRFEEHAAMDRAPRTVRLTPHPP